MSSTCNNCKCWDNSNDTTEANMQHSQYLIHPYTEYGECNNQKRIAHIFSDIFIFGNYTHKDYGCMFINLNSKK